MKRLVIAVTGVLFLQTTFAVVAEEITVYRDTYGVPHIYAETEGGGAYALGYTQAEDRLNDLYDNIRVALGTSAEMYGPDNVQTDYFMRVMQNPEKCEAQYQIAPPEQKVLCDRFVQGVEAYLAEHPEAKPETAFEIKPWHLMAIGRAMILRWPLGNVMDDLSNRHKKKSFGSNGWAVSSSRTADKCSILLADPHMEWEGMSVFFKAVVHAGDLHMDGYFLVGAPLVGIGHNGYVAWACTTGGPDTGDVYTLKINPQNPLEYEYGGEWKTGELKMITINVKGADPVTRPALYTVLGPVIAEPDTKEGLLYVGSTPYFEMTETFEQSYRMVKAKNAEEFYQALELNALMDQNIPFADRDGNIQYVRVGRTPIRPEGFDWNAPVYGSDLKSKYLGIYPISEHVQIKNPPQGYLQNCNISPENMMRNSPMTPDKYPAVLYNVTWDTDNPRSRRIVQLLEGNKKVSHDDAMSYATDVYDLLAKPWQKALKEAVAVAGQEQMKDAEFAAAVEDMLAWDGYFTKDSTATPVLKDWRLKCNDKVDVVAISKLEALTAADQQTMMTLLAQSIAEMKATYGKFPIAWGEAYVVGRGGVFYPTDGADFAGSTEAPNFTETLFDVRYRESEEKKGQFIGTNGTEALMLTFLHKDRVEAYNCVPWGQSADPKSKHYMDQGRDFYSPRKLKPTWFEKSELLAHVESEKTLSLP